MEYKSQKDLTGQHFGQWTVLRRAERPKYWVCRCDCGAEKEVYYHSLLAGKSRSCLSCANRGPKPGITKTSLKKAKKKEGQTINGWKVLEVLPEKTNADFLCMAICPKCRKKVKVKLTKLPRITQCATCARDIGQKADTVHAVTSVDGSSLLSIRARISGRINKNSTSGANGVSKDCHGRWRAYINFQRRQFYLGSYDTIEEAVAARKEAEELIYTPYLKEHEGWENELAEKLDALKKSKK